MTFSASAPFRNAIFERDFVLFCRTRRWFLLRTSYVAAVLLAVWLFFLHSQGDIRSGNLDTVGRNLFAAACFTQLFAVATLVPPVLADLISRERRTGNLSVLLTTPLSEGGIVLGKLFSRLALLLVMVASSFPAISVTMLFGGVRVDQVAALFVLSAGVVLLVSGPTLLFSACSKTPGVATLLGYFVAFVPAAAWYLAARPDLSWVSAAFVVAFPAGAAPSGFTPLAAASRILLLGLAVGCLSTILAAIRLRRERVGAGVHGLRSRIRAATVRPKAYDRANPMVPREARLLRGGGGASSFRVVLVVLLAMEGAFLLLPRGWMAGVGSAVAPHAFLVTLEGFVILLYAALSGATSVIVDRERGAMDLVRLTGLSPRDVVVGKMLGTFWVAILLGVVPVAHLLFFGAGSAEAFVGTCVFAAISAALALLSSQLGVANSIQARTVAQAIRRTAWHLSWFTIAVPLLFMILMLLQSGRLRLEPTGFTLLAPLYLAGEAAVTGKLGVLATFSGVAYGTVLAILLVGTWLIHFPGYSRSLDTGRARQRDSLAQWQDSWKRLTADWDEEG